MEVSTLVVTLAMHFTDRYLGVRVRVNEKPPNGSFPHLEIILMQMQDVFKETCSCLNATGLIYCIFFVAQ